MSPASADREEVLARVSEVRDRIADAARRAGRRPDSVTLVAVSKTIPSDLLRVAVETGVTDVGENRAQELVAKAAELADLDVRWHFVGRVQRNKVRMVAPLVVRWHSVDRAELAPLLARHSPTAPVLVQVNVSDEVTKGGCALSEVEGLVSVLSRSGLDVDGLMTVPPQGVDPRPYFDRLRAEAARLGLQELSMGMTDDFETAIEHGATFVRVGRACFGARRDPGGPRR